MENTHLKTEFNSQFSPYILVNYVTPESLFIQAEHGDNWREIAETEIEILTRCFKKYDWFKCIEHIGSTSIPGITAKPVIDLMLGVEYISSERNDTRDIRDRIITKELRELGYKSGEGFYLWKLFGDICVNIHPVATKTLRWKSRVEFRDCLIENEEYRKEYERIKKLLIEQKLTFEQYVYMKSRFIALIFLKKGWNPIDIVNGDIIEHKNLMELLKILETGGSHENH